MVVCDCLRARYLLMVIAFATLATSVWYAKNDMDSVPFPSSVADDAHVMMEVLSGSSLALSVSEGIYEVPKTFGFSNPLSSFCLSSRSKTALSPV